MHFFQSDTAILKIREVMLEIPQGKGGFITIRDVLEEGISNIRSSASFDNADMGLCERKQLEGFMDKMEKVSSCFPCLIVNLN